MPRSPVKVTDWSLWMCYDQTHDCNIKENSTGFYFDCCFKISFKLRSWCCSCTQLLKWGFLLLFTVCTYLRVSSEQLKGLIHLSLLNTSTQVQKVGWLSSMQINDVTCGHGQTSSIHCENPQNTKVNLWKCWNTETWWEKQNILNLVSVWENYRDSHFPLLFLAVQPDQFNNRWRILDGRHASTGQLLN